MKFSDYHTHHYRCKHASGTIEEYIKKGIHRSLQEIGISDHFPFTFFPERYHKYAMTFEEIPTYFQEIEKLKAKYKDIVIKTGFEADYFAPTFPKYRKALLSHYDNLDYIIGSLHTVTLKKEV